MNIIVINNQGLMDLINVNKNNILSYLHEKNEDYQCLYNWKYNNYNIHIYGIINSDSELLNNHKLPPHGISKIVDTESNVINLYGDIYVCKYNKQNLVSYSISEYGELFEYYSYYLSDDELDSDVIEDNNEIFEIEKPINEYLQNTINKNKTYIHNKDNIELELDNTNYNINN